MDIIEMCGILVVEEYTEIAVGIIDFSQTFKSPRKFKRCHIGVRQNGQRFWGGDFTAFSWSGQRINLRAIEICDLPTVGEVRLPAFGFSVLEIVAFKEWKFV
jgi:hypothetical protein